MSLNPLTLINQLIEEHGSSTIQAKHLAMLKDQITILQRQAAEATVKAEKLETENQHLRKQLEKLNPGGFVKSEGLLWRKTENGFEPRPYCPSCPDHPVMTPHGPWWTCPGGEHAFDYHIKPPKNG
jgi:hypothetical protein